MARGLEGAVRLNRLARTVTLTVMHAVMFMFIILYTDFQRFYIDILIGNKLNLNKL